MNAYADNAQGRTGGTALIVGLIAASVFVLVLAVGHRNPSWAAIGPWPTSGGVTRDYDPPDPDWLPGHRGVDLGAGPGESVLTPRPGVVLFVGRVAGTPTVVIGHGATRATYQPVVSGLAVGTSVERGSVIGTLATTGGGHCPTTCLHWGLRIDSGYLDPRLLLGELRVVLEPTDL